MPTDTPDNRFTNLLLMVEQLLARGHRQAESWSARIARRAVEDWSEMLSDAFRISSLERVRAHWEKTSRELHERLPPVDDGDAS